MTIIQKSWGFCNGKKCTLREVIVYVCFRLVLLANNFVLYYNDNNSE